MQGFIIQALIAIEIHTLVFYVKTFKKILKKSMEREL